MRPVRKLWAEYQAAFDADLCREAIDAGAAVLSMLALGASLVFWGVVLGVAL